MFRYHLKIKPFLFLKMQSIRIPQLVARINLPSIQGEFVAFLRRKLHTAFPKLPIYQFNKEGIYLTGLNN